MKTGVTVRTLDPVGAKPPREGGRKVPHRGTFYFMTIEDSRNVDSIVYRKLRCSKIAAERQFFSVGQGICGNPLSAHIPHQ